MIYSERVTHRVEREQIHVAVQCYPFGGSIGFMLPGPSSRVDGAAAETIESIREHSRHQPPDWHGGVRAALSIVKLEWQYYIEDTNVVRTVHRSFANAPISQGRVSVYFPGFDSGFKSIRDYLVLYH
jgi:hypothetical protein